MEITRALFDEQRRPRFGTSNPERMRLEFWERMVREGLNPYALRQQFDLPLCSEDGPIWCFGPRMGASRTEMPDGRVICVGGEHEDWYDPDFCIYNDVAVLGPGDSVEIYGYPREVFPPTDFHTATLAGDRIVVIGCVGYGPDRVPGTTPVFSLDTRTYRIEPVHAEGEPPGWISHHEAGLDPDGEGITVRGGKAMERDGNRFQFRDNLDEYRLDLRTSRWVRLTNRRGWRQFVITRTDGEFLTPGADRLPDDVFHPEGVAFDLLPDLDWRTRQVAVSGVPVSLAEELDGVRVIVRGELPDAAVQKVLADVSRKLEAAVGQPCRVVEMA